MMLEFKHTDNKNELINVTYKTALVVQALKVLSKNNVESKELHRISKLLTKTEKVQMLSKAMRVTSWVYEQIRLICRGGSYESNRKS